MSTAEDERGARYTAEWKASIVWTQVTTADGRADMTLAAFDELDDYSCTLPSGTFIAKRWKRGQPYEKPRTWWMGEYAEDADPKLVKIIWREIFVRGLRATDENIEKIRNATDVEKSLVA